MSKRKWPDGQPHSDQLDDDDDEDEDWSAFTSLLGHDAAMVISGRMSNFATIPK